MMQTVETLNEGLKRAYSITIPAGDIAARVDEEVKRIAQKSSDQAMPRFNDAFITLDGVGTNGGIVSSSDDPLYEEAYRLVVAEQKASTSWLQRQFRIGYNRAASLMDALEQNGVIGPASGSRPRLVLVHSDESEEE